MKKFFLCTTALNLLGAIAYANSNAASKIYVCATAQNTELGQVDYEALSWVEIKAISNRGEQGKNTNILTFPTWDTTVVQKSKGMTDAGSPVLEVARIATDAGQIILRAAGAVGNNNNYAFKEVRNDAVGVGTPTIRYNRGLVTGPVSPGGSNEDFDIERYTLAFQQEEIVVNPTTSGNPPVLTVIPAISGTAQVGETLTSSTGTFTGDATITYTYQWFAGGVAISGATSSTFDLTSTQLGKVITVRVTATNSVGSAYGFSSATSAVIA